MPSHISPLAHSFRQVYCNPFQWSFPLNLPPQFFGIFPTGELKTGDPDAPWADEIEQSLFLPPSIGEGQRALGTSSGECRGHHNADEIHFLSFLA